MDAARLSELRDTLLATHECARALRAHEVAYHALAGALHAAEDLRDSSTLDLVEQQARSHLTLLDRTEPSHRHATAAAASRGHHSVFEQLAVLAAAARVRLKAEQQQKGRPQAPFRGQNANAS